MNTKIVVRILKEVQEVNEGDAQLKDQIYLQAVDDADIRKLQGFIRGPPDTPYENGIFNLLITLPDEYPFKPPMVTFKTKIYHPNIRTTGGYICLDVLSQAWTPTMSLKSMLLSLQLLLQDPRADDPLEPSIALMLRRDRENFNRTAFFWTGEHALTADERTTEWRDMNAMVTRTMKRRRVGRSKAINLLARQGWRETARKRKRNENDEENEEEEEVEADGEPGTSRARVNVPPAPVEDEEEESDDEVPPEVIRMISMAMARQGFRVAGTDVDEDEDEDEN